MNPEDARIALLSAPHSPPVSLLESCSHSSGALRVEYPRNNFWPLHKLMLRDLSHPRGDSVHLYVVRNGELHRETSVTVYDQADPEAQAEALLTSLDVQPGDTLYGVLFGRSHITNLPQSFWFNATQITEPVRVTTPASATPTRESAMKKLRPSSGCAVMLACTSVTPRTLKDVGARMKALAPTFSVEHSNMMSRARKLEQDGYIAIVRGGYRLHITRTPAGTAELNRLQHGAPSTNPDRSWYVLVDDRQVGEAAPNPRAAAVNYYRCRVLDGEHEHPASVEVAQAIIPTHAELVAGLTQGILDDLECAMSDVGGEHAEDACLAIRNTGDSLADVMAEWLAYRLPKINFWQWTGMQRITLADVAGELSTTQPT